MPWVVWVDPAVYCWSAHLHSEVFIRAECGTEPCPWAPWPPACFLVQDALNALHCPGAGDEGGLQLLCTAHREECRLTRAPSTFHMGLRRRGLNRSLVLVIPGRHFHAAGKTNGKYTTTGCSLHPRDTHTSSRCLVGSQTVMEKSTARTVRDVTERISKGTRHLCLDSWTDAWTSLHHSHKHLLHFWASCTFQSFSIAMCQSRALGDTFTQFGTAASCLQGHLSNVLTLQCCLALLSSVISFFFPLLFPKASQQLRQSLLQSWAQNNLQLIFCLSLG